MRKLPFLLIILISCTNRLELIEEARIQSDEVINNLTENDAAKYFHSKYFGSKEINQSLENIRNVCEYENRRGGFVDYFSESGIKGNRVYFIYEFYLKCDSVRFILNYDLAKPPTLVQFKVEPIELDNFMIIDKSKQLKNR